MLNSLTILNAGLI